MSYHVDSNKVLWMVFKFIGAAILSVLLVKAMCDRQKYEQHIMKTCKPIRHISGDTIMVFTDKGIGTAYVSEKTCYRCPDGFEECF